MSRTTHCKQAYLKAPHARCSYRILTSRVNLEAGGKGPLMLHAPVAGCTVGEGKVGLILEYVDGTVRASTRDLQKSGKLLVSQI